jgi:hypothetical protein
LEAVVKQYIVAWALFVCLFSGQANGASQPEPIGGRPPAGARPSVVDLDYQIAYQRAFEAVLWGLPAAAIYRFRAAAFDVLGAQDNTILAMSGLATPKAETLTANSNAPYTAAFTDLRKGPVVLEIPAASDKASMYGQIVDAWQVTIADIGPAGADRGKGAKYLLVPPNYDQPLPEGYLPVKSESNRVAFAFRSVPAKGATIHDAYVYAQTLKMYYLAEAANPPATRFIDPTDMHYPTLPFYDERFFADLHAIISAEPVRARDKVMMGMLASLGISPDRPYAPDAKTLKAMRTAVTDAYFHLQQDFWRHSNTRLYWPDRHYASIYEGDAQKQFVYETATELQIDGRARQFFPFTFLPSRIAERPAVMYLGALADAAGKPFVAGKTYRVTIPKEVPVRQFWSLIVYDAATFAFIYNPLNRTGRSSFDRDTMKANADGSVTLYIGPKAPAGLESNWIPTQGKRPYPYFRLYGPQEAVFDKSFRFADFEFVKQ